MNLQPTRPLSGESELKLPVKNVFLISINKVAVIKYTFATASPHRLPFNKNIFLHSAFLSKLCMVINITMHTQLFRSAVLHYICLRIFNTSPPNI